MEKNKIISLSTTLLYSFVLVISFLCFYHSIVESSWLLEIIVSLFVLIGVNLLSYKTKTKEIIFPIVMTFIIGIIYSFQSFYYGFWGIINYCIQWYNVQFDDARNLMMTKAITTSHIQAFSLVVILFITYFIYRSIKKEKMMGIILIFSIVFAFTLWIDRFSFIGGSLCIITLLMIWMYYQNKVINSKTVQWLVIISIIFVAVALPVYQDNLSLQQIKKEVLQQVEDLRYGKDNLPQGNLKQASIIHENEEEKTEKIRVIDGVKAVLKNKYWHMLMVISICINIFFQAISTVNTYYSKAVLHNSSMISILNTAYIVPAIATFFFVHLVVKKYGKGKTTMFGWIIICVSYVILLPFTENTTVLIITAAMRGVGYCFLLAVSSAMVSDAVEYGEWKTKIRVEGLTFSMQGFVGTIAAGIVTAVIGWVLNFSKYDGTLSFADTQAGSAVLAIKLLFIAVPFVVGVLNIILLKFYKLDKMYPQIIEDLNKRNGK